METLNFPSRPVLPNKKLVNVLISIHHVCDFTGGSVVCKLANLTSPHVKKHHAYEHPRGNNFVVITLRVLKALHGRARLLLCSSKCK